MSLSSLPALVIARLRAECALFEDRVAGAAKEATASDQTEWGVPHAFFAPGGIEPGEGQISPYEQELQVRFTVLVTVGNNERIGQEGTTGFYAAVAQVIPALVGWNPDADEGFSPVVCLGVEDDYAFNPARFSGAVTFMTTIMSSRI